MTTVPSPAPSPSPVAQAAPAVPVVIVTTKGNFGVRGWAEDNIANGLPHHPGLAWIPVILTAAAPARSAEQKILEVAVDSLNHLNQPIFLVAEDGSRNKCAGQSLGRIVESTVLLQMEYEAPEVGTRYGLTISDGEPVQLPKVDIRTGR